MGADTAAFPRPEVGPRAQAEADAEHVGPDGARFDPTRTDSVSTHSNLVWRGSPLVRLGGRCSRFRRGR